MIRLLLCSLAVAIVCAECDFKSFQENLVQYPNFTTPSQHFSGYLPINQTEGTQLYYYFVESERSPKDDPLVLWLQGGPGCSSMLGMFEEVGPIFVVDDKFTLKENPNAWSKFANVLFIDQPVGTGFSFVNEDQYSRTLQESTTTLAIGLQQFYKKFCWVQNLPFYLTGESYAGKYIPALAHKILTDKLNIPLKGLAIGDGWTSPLEQTSVLGAQAFMLGFIDHKEQLKVNEMYRECESLVLAKSWSSAATVCDSIQGYIVDAAGGVDINDVRHFGESFPAYVKDYLNTAEAKQSLGVPDFVTFDTCTAGPAAALRDDEMQSVKDLLPDLLDNYRVILYNGQFDLNCGIAGTEVYLLSLSWEGANEYRNADKKVWRVGNRVAGYARTARNLTQLTIVEAGHLVPMNQPGFALQMLKQLLEDTPFE